MDRASLTGMPAGLGSDGVPRFSVETASSLVARAASPKATDILPGAGQIVALSVLVEDLRARVTELEGKS
jgi:hypothetical protein